MALYRLHSLNSAILGSETQLDWLIIGHFYVLYGEIGGYWLDLIALLPLCNYDILLKFQSIAGIQPNFVLIEFQKFMHNPEKGIAPDAPLYNNAGLSGYKTNFDKLENPDKQKGSVCVRCWSLVALGLCALGTRKKINLPKMTAINLILPKELFYASIQ